MHPHSGILGLYSPGTSSGKTRQLLQPALPNSPSISLLICWTVWSAMTCWTNMNLNEQSRQEQPSLPPPSLYLFIYTKLLFTVFSHWLNPTNDNESKQISWSLDCGKGGKEVVEGESESEISGQRGRLEKPSCSSLSEWRGLLNWNVNWMPKKPRKNCFHHRSDCTEISIYLSVFIRKPQLLRLTADNSIIRVSKK